MYIQYYYIMNIFSVLAISDASRSFFVHFAAVFAFYISHYHVPSL